MCIYIYIYNYPRNAGKLKPKGLRGARAIVVVFIIIIFVFGDGCQLFCARVSRKRSRGQRLYQRRVVFIIIIIIVMTVIIITISSSSSSSSIIIIMCYVMFVHSTVEYVYIYTVECDEVGAPETPTGAPDDQSGKMQDWLKYAQSPY